LEAVAVPLLPTAAGATLPGSRAHEEFIELWLSLGLGMIGGVLAWLAIEWVGKPIAAFLALRGSVIEELHFYATVDEESPPEIREEARNRLRRLSRKMYELNEDSNMSLHLYFSWRQTDFRLAAEGLVGASNCLPAQRDGSMALMQDMVERGMGLRRTHSDRDIRDIRARLAAKIGATDIRSMPT
jgi:hypothetical protein